MANYAYISNTTGVTQELHWGFMSGDSFRQRMITIYPYALNLRLDFMSEEDEKMFLQTKEHLFETGILKIGETTSSKMGQLKESLDNKIEDRKSEIQSEATAHLEERINKATKQDTFSLSVEGEKPASKKGKGK